MGDARLLTFSGKPVLFPLRKIEHSSLITLRVVTGLRSKRRQVYCSLIGGRGRRMSLQRSEKNSIHRQSSSSSMGLMIIIDTQSFPWSRSIMCSFLFWMLVSLKFACKWPPVATRNELFPRRLFILMWNNNGNIAHYSIWICSAMISLIRQIEKISQRSKVSINAVVHRRHRTWTTLVKRIRSLIRAHSSSCRRTTPHNSNMLLRLC